MDQVRHGVLVDLGFAGVLCASLGLVIAATDGPWWVALLAFVLDLAEGLVLWVLLRRIPPTDVAVRSLFLVAVAKFAAYTACLPVLVRSAWELTFG